MKSFECVLVAFINNILCFYVSVLFLVNFGVHYEIGGAMALHGVDVVCIDVNCRIA